MVGELAVAEPLVPEVGGEHEPVVGVVVGLGAAVVAPRQRDERGVAVAQRGARAGAPALEADAQVGGQRQLDGLALGAPDRLAVAGPRVLPRDRLAPVVHARLALHVHLDAPVDAAHRAQQHVVGVVVGRRAPVRVRALVVVVPGPDEQHVAHDDPARAGAPRRLEDHRARQVALARGHRGVHRREPERRRRRGRASPRRSTGRRSAAGTSTRRCRSAPPARRPRSPRGTRSPRSEETGFRPGEHRRRHAASSATLACPHGHDEHCDRSPTPAGRRGGQGARLHALRRRRPGPRPAARAPGARRRGSRAHRAHRRRRGAGRRGRGRGADRGRPAVRRGGRRPGRPAAGARGGRLLRPARGAGGGRDRGGGRRRGRRGHRRHRAARGRAGPRGGDGAGRGAGADRRRGRRRRRRRRRARGGGRRRRGRRRGGAVGQRRRAPAHGRRRCGRGARRRRGERARDASARAGSIRATSSRRSPRRGSSPRAGS